ncbi:hypothetical protein KDL01_27040 [Actinospica durhamensis]|uniref:AAA domain-containing protein n=1 Tax=Actinospica durhamensis TaxID=1508375 RepID=A0A941EV51_9ACTN|nr:hypothetical protein [Actinospica durhamensis]MBR7836962.1 hypothetical protein [Actinospica durhamensis]
MLDDLGSVVSNGDQVMTDPLDVPVPRRLFTWVDVDAHLTKLVTLGLWPEWLLECSAYWDSLVLTVAQNTAHEAVWTWLARAFGPLTVDPEAAAIQLESFDQSNGRFLPVQIAPNNGDELYSVRVPSWHDKFITRELANPLPAPKEPDFASGGVKVCAFHSYKGGVGRTLHAVALAMSLAADPAHPCRVLLVDADLEAPGITWMVAAEQPEINFSFEDFLALLHGSTDGTPLEAIALAGQYLEQQDLGDIVILPARRDIDRISASPISPIDLLNAEGRDQYFLTESIAQLAKAVGAEVAIVDLRAGTSELSAPVLLDPRVHRAFVTTLSDQSIRGTIKLLEEIGLRAPSIRETDPVATVIVTHHIPERSAALTRGAARLAAAVAGTVRGASPAQPIELDIAARPALSTFETDLVTLPGRWSEVIQKIKRNGLDEVVSELASALRPDRNVVAPYQAAISAEIMDRRRLELSGVCQRFAKFSSGDEMPPELMAADFYQYISRSIAFGAQVEVFVGGPGSGKTSLFLWLSCLSDPAVLLETTRTPTRSLPRRLTSAQAEGREVRMVPLYAPRDAMERLAQITMPPSLVDRSQTVASRIRDELQSAGAETRWAEMWVDCMAIAAGIAETEDAPTGREGLVRLARSQRTIFLLDGLDELFPDILTNEVQKAALAALWNEVMPWVETLRDNLGFIAFINPAVMPDRRTGPRYSSRTASLDWEQDDALNFVDWLCERARVRDAKEDTRRYIQQADSLDWLWGQRLGPNDSRVARSIDWFLDSVSGFNGVIRASDVAAVIGEAARLSVAGSDDSSSEWEDRVLAPHALIEAVERVGRHKVFSLIEFDSIVGPILKKMSELDSSLKVLPFDADAADLTRVEVRALLANSILHRVDGGQYWLSKLYRLGLGFEPTEFSPQLAMFRGVTRSPRARSYYR